MEASDKKIFGKSLEQTLMLNTAVRIEEDDDDIRRVVLWGISIALVFARSERHKYKQIMIPDQVYIIVLERGHQILLFGKKGEINILSSLVYE